LESQEKELHPPRLQGWEVSKALQCERENPLAQGLDDGREAQVRMTLSQAAVPALAGLC
jgi:hypothetical protein